jgi:uroporphyrinogen decarboxylase
MSSKALIDVLQGRRPTRRPIWFMRQAGRYLPEYRELRAKAGSFLDLCYDPALAAEITLQPLRRFDLDAAIVFADILLVPHAMGVPLKFAEGEGPVLGTVRSDDDLAKLKTMQSTSLLDRVSETVARVRTSLPEYVAVIGFCGGPWTVASYMIEGGSSVERERARRVAIENPPWFASLIDLIVNESVNYLCSQIEAGADVVQVFDSWAGDMPYQLHDRVIFGPLKRVCAGVRERHPHIPLILFARGLGSAHPSLAGMTGANCVGVEQSVDLAWASHALPAKCAVQGNLDPLILAVGGDPLDEGVNHILSSVGPERHVFNLGHGVRPETDPAMIARVINRVRSFDEARVG